MKRLLIATGVLAILTGVIWWSEKYNAAPESDAKTPPKILNLKDTDITSLEVTLKGEPAAVVVRGAAGNWSVTAPTALPGDQAVIGMLVTSLATLSADRVVDENLTDRAAYGLEPPLVSVQAKTKDGKTIHLRIGEETADKTGLYASLDGDKRLFALPAYSKDTFGKHAADLRDKHLLSVIADKVSRLELSVVGKPAIEFTRQGETQWQISRPRPMRADTLHVDELVSLVKDAEMDISMDEKTASAAFATSTPLATIRVTLPGGVQTLEVRKSGTDAFTRSALGIFKGTPNLGPGVDKSLDDFQNKKLFDFGFDDPTKVIYKTKDDDKTFEKSGTDWVMNGRAMDSVSIQNMIDKLRDFAAVSINEGAIGKGEIELTVVSKKGSRTEKVMISPSGDEFVAQRDREPGVYRIASTTMEELRQGINNVQQAAEPRKPDNKK